MRILIVEDDLASRRFMQKIMENYGKCDTAIDGIEALDAFLIALDEKMAYDLVCLDVMMPKVDGIKVLNTIRQIEKQRKIDGDRRVKIIMTTALNDIESVQNSFESGCEAYAAKPIDIKKLRNVMEKLNFSKKS